MSRTNRKNRAAATHSTNGDRHLQAVPSTAAQLPTPTTEDKVRLALAGLPGSTTAALAMAAGVGRSTAAKVLARWHLDGTAVRAAGDGPRTPDTWTLAQPDNAAPAPDTTGTPTDTAATSDTDHASTLDDVTTAEADATEAPGDGPSVENATAQVIPQDTSDADVNQATDEKTAETGSTASDEGGASVDATSPPPGSAPVAPVTNPTDNGSRPAAKTPPAGNESSKGTVPAVKERLRKGGLRALVEEYLTERPNESFGPAKIGHDLGRSGGAVNNALEKLVADGYAIKTCEAPKRFAINPGKTDVPPTTSTAP
ncbi:hypothetical protein ACIA5G_30355 [Amycolatopsis sp. NPDC051758]|uniref:hypothetical protein n=1 Tax=Amycolatopsis sp. NPDC051758 TaxID=3363935 RepID=UPI0037888DB8